MDDFLQQHLAANLRRAVTQAERQYAAGDIVSAMRICRQVFDRDGAALRPWALIMRHGIRVGDRPMIIEGGLMMLRTRPEIEGGADMMTECGMSYREIAETLIGQSEYLLASPQERERVVAAQALALAEHVLGNTEAARQQYCHVLTLGPSARRLAGETINLLHALAHQTGDPEAARRWLDLDQFPLRFSITDFLPEDEAWAFCDGLFDEVMASPLLKATTDAQSRGWVVGDRLNDPGCGPRIREMEGIFARLLTRCRPAFEALRHDFDHEIYKTFPARHAIKIFCAMLRGAGHVGPHVHNDGFLVGSLYVRVPDEPDGTGNRIGLIHGKHLYHAATGGNYRTRMSAPRTGDILVWPAYYSHAVPPTRATTPRMVVGFDLVPVTD